MILCPLFSDCYKSTVFLSYLVGLEMQTDMSKNDFKAETMRQTFFSAVPVSVVTLLTLENKANVGKR